MSVAIIDYGAGNLRSATKAFERAIAEAGSSEGVAVTSDPQVVRKADRVVLPGDGAFADCRRGLGAVPGMIEAVDEVIDAGRPFLGICVGMQLLAERGYEHGVTEGLARVPAEVRHIEPSDPALKVPHMGWNTLTARREHPLLAGIPLGPDGWHAFFLHAYHMVMADDRDLVAYADYGGRVSAVVAHDNIAGTQFHPEKSQRLGLRLIANFLAWRP
jgi:glutamine amidotransferase